MFRNCPDVVTSSVDVATSSVDVATSSVDVATLPQCHSRCLSSINAMSQH